MRAGVTVLIITIMLLSCGVNRFDRRHARHGRWITWYDSAETVRATSGRYRHGQERGLWRSWTPDGKLAGTERYNMRRKIIHTRYYHKNGKVSHKGTARMIPENGEMHYFWYGEWKFYDDSGRHIRSVWYQDGKELKEEWVK